MAFNLKIEGNFIAISDIDTLADLFRKPRSITTFEHVKDGADDLFVFECLNSQVRERESFDFTDIINDLTGLAFVDVTELDEFLSLNLGGVANPIFASKSLYSDYSKISSSTLPITLAKLDYSGAVMVSQTSDLFDEVNSRIVNFDPGQVGLAFISMVVDASGGGHRWVEFALKGFDVSGTELFQKRSTTVNMFRTTSTHNVHLCLDFYFGGVVSYFEVWYLGSSALPFQNPEITVVKT